MVAEQDERVVATNIRRPMKSVATHSDPAWRDKSNFIVMASLGSHGMPGRWEQLWARRIAEDGEKFEICCIPFFTYGIALGDIVRTEVDREFEYVVSEVVTRQGHQTLRVAVVHRHEAEQIHRRLHDAFSRIGALHEWLAAGYVAVDVPNANRRAEIQKVLQPLVDERRISLEID